ncbi:MAG: hypothetical protein ACE5M4_09115 [Anaerolineales bacterium]
MSDLNLDAIEKMARSVASVDDARGAFAQTILALVKRCRKAEETLDAADYYGEAGLAVELVQKDKRIAELEAMLLKLMSATWTSDLGEGTQGYVLDPQWQERIRALLGKGR